jgi:hypothetical protein
VRDYFYHKKLFLFIALYLFTITSVMQGDSFFKHVKWLADFSASVNFQSVEDVFDEGSTRFTKILLNEIGTQSNDDIPSFFSSPLFLAFFIDFKKNNQTDTLAIFSTKQSFVFVSTLSLYLRYCMLLC